MEKKSWWLTTFKYKEVTLDKIRGVGGSLRLAPHILSKKEKETLCVVLLTLKVSDGYSSNLGSHISMNKPKFQSMKEHDFHILMQQLLPIVLCHVLPKVVWNTICRICFIYRWICEKIVDPSYLENLMLWIHCSYFKSIPPPSFFYIMLHFTIQLVRELRLCGLVAYPWMCPFERLVKLYNVYKST